MAGITFRGKSAVQNHHLAAPFRELVPAPEKSVTDAVSLDDNLIIHGDNLEGLKALLPTHAGSVKCVYIDVPYNTGNEKWVYNDNVSSPLVRGWLGTVVDKDDLTRHEKWLCMMMPRLTLIRDLLTDDGVVFISIDDNEMAALKMLMDEIFGEGNFIANIVVRLNPRGRTLDKFMAKTHEYVLLYAKNSAHATCINQIPKTEKALREYCYEDEGGPYRLLELRNRNPVFHRGNRPNLYYPFFIDPETGTVSLVKDEHHTVETTPQNSKGEDGCWSWSKDKVSKEGDVLVGRQVRSGGWRVYRKDYSLSDSGEAATTKAKALWLESSINNEYGKETLTDIFDGTCPFDFPKSVDLVKMCVVLGSRPGDLVLDSFAGSGTTAQAVLELNAEESDDYPARRFILVEFEDYANTITAERVRRLIPGVPEARREEMREPLGGTFTYLELGKSVSASSLLLGDELPSFADLARYVFFTATGQAIDGEKVDEKSGLIGETERYRVYLLYSAERDTLRTLALTLDRARELSAASEKTVLVFAPTKYLDVEQMRDLNVEFCQLPFDIFRLKA